MSAWSRRRRKSSIVSWTPADDLAASSHFQFLS
jgi:hypothetical protein